MKIAIIGASGYIGSNLIKLLLIDNSRDKIVAVSTHATGMALEDDRLEKVDCDILTSTDIQKVLQGCDVVYYLIHMMAQNKMDFVKAEAIAAHHFVQAANAAQVKRIIYLGGLGNDQDHLSRHLASRHHTGEILRSGSAQVIEFRASMVIGDGSISYDIIKRLVHKLPILTIPKWSKTMTQPIGLSDTLNYLLAAKSVQLDHSEIVEIGGPEQMSYRNLMERYAKWEHKKAIFIYLPIIPVGISAWWLNLFTPKKHAKVGRVMVESLVNPMVVTTKRATELFPQIKPKLLEDVFV